VKPRASTFSCGGDSEVLPKAVARTTPRARPRVSTAGSLLELPPSPSRGKAGDDDEKATGKGRLTAEQNALVSGCVSLLTVALAAGLTGLWEEFGMEMRSSESPRSWSARDVSAAVGGCVHFLAYLSTLCAFSSASSTVITPLMQLSAVWMLPFSTLAAALGFATFIRPVHLLAVVFICAGGFLPAADGSLWLIVSKRFWKQKAVRCVVLGELLVCLYNMILHQATFALESSGAEDGNLGPGVSGDTASTMRFFLISRAANGLTCAAVFILLPSFRHHALALRSVSPAFVLAAFAGECLSMVGVCLVSFSYSAFYEPSVVNAAEGGLQQLFNLLFALTSHHVLGWGRAVDQVSVKCVSFALVATGLTLSTA